MDKIIYSYRIEQAINILQKDELKNESKIYKKIIYAVDIHRKAMELVYVYLIRVHVNISNVHLIRNI